MQMAEAKLNLRGAVERFKSMIRVVDDGGAGGNKWLPVSEQDGPNCWAQAVF